MAKLTIGEFLSVLRKAKGLTQEAVAEQLGVSAKSVSSWENNRNYPDIMMLPVIAELYGVTVDELVRGERNVKEEPDERKQTVSEESVRRIRKRKYATYNEKRKIFSLIALASACLSVLGCYLTCFVATWTMVFAILGFLGAATGIILAVINEKEYLLGEGIAISSDITENAYSMVLTVSKKTLLPFVLTSIPYNIYGALMWIIYLIDTSAFEYDLGNELLSMSINLTDSVLTVAGIALAIGLVLIVYALVKRIVLIRKYGNEEHKTKQKKNIKLTVILMSIAAGMLILGELAVGIAYIVTKFAPYDYDEELFDNCEDFKNFMQTVYRDILISPSEHCSYEKVDDEMDDEGYVVVSAGTLIEIPGEAFSTKTSYDVGKRFEFIPGEYDCGNSLYIIAHDSDDIYISAGTGIERPVYLIYRIGNEDIILMDLTNRVMAFSHPNADGSDTVCEPIVNIRYGKYFMSDSDRNENNTIVKTINGYMSGNSEEIISTEKFIAEYMDSGKYKGKYGLFIYEEIYSGYALMTVYVWLKIMIVYSIVAVILFAVKYKRQKFELEFLDAVFVR